MSKAFTREIDDSPEPVIKSLVLSQSSGVKNYFTPRGLHNLQLELAKLSDQPTSPQVRQRLLECQHILQSAVVVEPPPLPWTQVFFGATVSVQNSKGEKMNYRIVGVNETDLDKNHISWLSPVAKALLKKRVGDEFRFHTPDGDEAWQITGLRYEDQV